MNFPLNINPAPSCLNCEYLDDCGGLVGEAFDRGCFQRCNAWCVHHGCDMACPSNALDFPDMIAEIRGLNTLPRGLLAVPDPQPQLPYYLPLINHASSRDSVLDEEWVVVALYNLMARDRRGRVRIRYETPEKLRQGLRLGQHARIIISSVAEDHHIEAFWAQHRSRHLLEAIAALKPFAMTVPNYSFMRDVPRTNNLYNFGRMFRMAERMTAAGVPPALHLQALTPFDWNIWASVLKEQSAARFVALEFQTGAEHKEFGEWYYAGLVELQERLSRPLHPLLLAGGRKLRVLRDSFETFSIIDSMPFIKTMKRQVLEKWGDRWKWRTLHTEENAPLDDRMDYNLAAYRRRLYEILGVSGDGEIQGLLPMNNAMRSELALA